MKEKAIKKYNHIDVLTPMVYALNLSGCRLLVFAYIQGFCRDEASVCYSSLTHISEVIGYARRTVAEAVAALISDGYIYKIGTMTIDGKNVSGYRTYFFELMDRYDAGEDVSPTLLNTRRGLQKSCGAQSALVACGAQNDVLAVHKTASCGAQNSIAAVHKTALDNTSNNTRDNLSDSAPAGAAHAREAEEREFYKIFFLRNAGNPADEVRRFVGWYDSREWTDSRGRKYETIAQRRGLAYTWDCKSGLRLAAGENTDKFYKFLGSLYNYAAKHGGIDPQLILDPRGGYRLKDGDFTWDCTDTVRAWFESLGPVMRIPLNKYIGEGCKLFYGKAS